MRGAWGGVKIMALEAGDEPADLGADRSVTVTVELGALAPADIEVQLIHGRVAQHDQLQTPAITVLTCQDPEARPTTYAGTMACTTPGRYGFTVRALPSHPDLPTPVDLGIVTWA